MERNATNILDDLREGPQRVPHIDGENMHACEILEDSENHEKTTKLSEARFMKEFTVTEKVYKMPRNAYKASGDISNEEYFLGLTQLFGTGGKTCIKQQKDISERPMIEILGEHKHFHNRLGGSQEQTADKESTLGAVDVAEKTFDFNRYKTKVKSRISNAVFSEQLWGSWEEGVHPSSPVNPDEEYSKGDVFSFSQNGETAYKAQKRMSDNDYILKKGQCEEQLAFPIKHDGKKGSEQEFIASESDFSWGLDGKIEETDERNCRKETYFKSESLSKSSPSKRENIKANATIKSCHLLLEDSSYEKKEKHYCLKPPNAKKPPPRSQNDKDAFLKQLQVVVCDFLHKSSKNPRKPLPPQNAERSLENENVNAAERDLELNSPAKVLNFEGPDTAGTNADQDTEKSGHSTKSPNISTLCEQGIFARCSFMGSGHENSVMGFLLKEEGEKITEKWQGVSVLTSETQRLKTTCFKPTETIMEYRSKLVKPLHGELTCHKAEDYQETLRSTFSGEPVTEDIGQSSGINLPSVSCGKTFHTSSMDSACPSETSSSEAKCSDMSLERISASSLPDKIKRGMLQRNSGFEPHVSSHLTGRLKLKFKDVIPSKTKIKTSRDRRTAPDCNVLDEKTDEDQMDVEQSEMVSRSDSICRNRNPDSCCFLLEIDEVTDKPVSVSATGEENKLELGIDGPQSKSMSVCQSPKDETTVIKHSVLSGIMADDKGGDGDISKAKENINPQLGEANSPVGEEEGLQPHQSQGRQIVFYEMSGSTVRLLGTPGNNRDIFSLGKLVELEESSSDKESQGSIATLSPGGKNEVGLLSKKKPLHFEDGRSKKRSRRANSSSAPTHCSQLSQEQSRAKVVDTLREALQKRVDASPDLNIQKNTVSKIAKQVEREIFKLSCCVDQHYRNKYRSLLFNLKSPENQPLFHRVILGEISPKRLVQMTSLEMAPKELAEWRAKENKRVLEIIQKEEQEAPRRCSAKFTHKGIIEIHREVEEDLTAQEIFESQSFEVLSSENLMKRERDSGCLKCPGQRTADSENGFKPSAGKHNLKWKANASRQVDSEGEEKSLEEDSRVSPGILKKRRVKEPPRTSAVWKGIIHMFSIKQFWAKAYPVSGSSGDLCQGLPHLLQSKGCILPEDVWAYLDSIWPAHRKEMGVIRFQPSLSKDTSPYHMLYSYLNNKQRYGMVNSNQMEIFMVPLAAFQPVPSKLHPLGGPGLDPSHPSLLLGLILPKRTCRSGLEVQSSPLPKAKKKTIAWSDSTETQCLALSSHSQGGPGQLVLPKPLSEGGLFCGKEDQAEIPQQELFTLDAFFAEFGRETIHSDTFSFLTGLPGAEASPVTSGEHLQSVSCPPWTEPQVGNLTLFLMLPEAVGPGQHGTNGTQATDVVTEPSLTRILSTESVPPCEAAQVLPSAQILCPSSVTGESSSLAGEILSFIQHMDQLQSHIQSQELQPPPCAQNTHNTLSLPVIPPEITSAFSQAVAGLELPLSPEDSACVHLQQLLSTLSGQTQPPPAL